MNIQVSLMKYAINYLSKFSSSKKNLSRKLKNKIMRMKIEKKDKFLLYNSIPQIILKLENNKLINDKNYSLSKIRSFIQQGKSKFFIKNYLIQKGVEKLIISDSIKEFEFLNPDWERDSAKIFIRKKKLIKSPENNQENLTKMARAGFSYDLCKNILKSN
jgi:SOS response regulatory protein OraA/RecX